MGWLNKYGWRAIAIDRVRQRLVVGNLLHRSVTVIQLDPALAVTGNGVLITAGAPAAIDTGADFGSVAVGGTITRTFTISNAGDGSLRIDTATIDVSAFAARGSAGISLANGASHTLTVVFNPAASGMHSATIAIASNDPACGGSNFPSAARQICTTRRTTQNSLSASNT